MSLMIGSLVLVLGIMCTAVIVFENFRAFAKLEDAQSDEAADTTPPLTAATPAPPAA